MRFVILRFLALVWAVGLLVSNAIGQTVSRAYCGDDRRAHIAFANGIQATINPQLKQVGCSDVSVANDQRTVAWSVLFDNCCTSYPIAGAIVVYRDGHRTVISPGQMVWRWRFMDGGEQIAVLSGPVHGFASKATLYDRRGKRLESWNGIGTPPRWAEGWEDEFEQ